MNRFKYQAFLTEFPTLGEILHDWKNNDVRPAHDCTSIIVQRITPKLLSATPEFNSHVGSLVDIARREAVSFVLADGKVLYDCVRTQGTHGSNYAHEDTYSQEGETILEAIHRLQVASQLTLIVIVKSGFTVVDHCSTNDFDVTIYKPAKEVNIQSIIHEAEQAAIQQVRAEANF